MKIIKIQTALFTNNLNIADDYAKLGVLDAINKDQNIQQIFGGKINIVPVPANAPIEIPRFILNNQNNDYSCNISPNRTDIFLNRSGNEEITSILESQKERVLKVFNFLKERGAIINRVGFVVFYEYEKQDSIKFLEEKFITAGSAKDSKEITIRRNKESVLGETNFNSIIDISAKKESNIINVFTDINTTVEQMPNKDFNISELTDIINFFIKENIRINFEFPTIS